MQNAKKIARVSEEVAKSVLAGNCLVGSASAANLYKEGRIPYRMLEEVEPVHGCCDTDIHHR
jgi:hypothetical protein